MICPEDSEVPLLIYDFSTSNTLSLNLNISASFSLNKLWILMSLISNSPNILTGSEMTLVVRKVSYSETMALKIDSC